jgi:hypothetical protein
MDNLELCARNVRAALREVRNAYNAAKEIEEDGEKYRRDLDQVIHHLEGLSFALRLRQQEHLVPPLGEVQKVS